MSFNVKFKINDNLEVTECGLDNMMFAEFIYNLSQKVGLKEEHKPTFTFNSEILKMDSMRKLSEIGITSNSVINVKTEKPLDYKPQNTGNSEAPQNNSASTGTNMNAGNMNMNQNMNAGNMNMNQNMNAGNMNMNQNMYAGNMNMNQNMNAGNMNMNQNMYAGAMNMNQNMYAGAMNMSPNMYAGAMNMNQNIYAGAMNMNPNMYYGNMIMNPNMYYGSMNMNQNMNNFVNNGNNQNMNNFANVANNQNMNNLANAANNQNVGQNTNNQNNNISPASPGIPGCMNIIFNNQGKNVTIQTQKEAKFCEVATKFANKAGVLDKKPSFIISSQKIEMTCDLTVDQLKIKDNNKIEVIYESDIKGA